MLVFVVTVVRVAGCLLAFVVVWLSFPLPVVCVDAMLRSFFYFYRRLALLGCQQYFLYLIDERGMNRPLHNEEHMQKEADNKTLSLQQQ